MDTMTEPGERIKASIRAKLELLFLVTKCQYSHVNTRYAV